MQTTRVPPSVPGRGTPPAGRRSAPRGESQPGSPRPRPGNLAALDGARAAGGWLAALFRLVGTLVDGFCDLVLGRCCAGCGVPGRVACPRCRAAMARWRPVEVHRRGIPPGVAAAHYDDIAARLLVSFKDRDAPALAAPLGEVLAFALLSRWPPGERVVLVPVPSSRAGRRRRGYDHTTLLARRAARSLRRQGVPASVARLLERSRIVEDQSQLDLAGRARNQQRSMRLRRSWSGGGRGRVQGREPRQTPTPIVVIDDIVTTGATVREAVRVLEAGGQHVAGVAAVAETPLRQGAGPVGGHLPNSADLAVVSPSVRPRDR